MEKGPEDPKVVEIDNPLTQRRLPNQPDNGDDIVVSCCLCYLFNCLFLSCLDACFTAD